jgi:hypothetical protein
VPQEVEIPAVSPKRFRSVIAQTSLAEGFGGVRSLLDYIALVRRLLASGDGAGVGCARAVSRRVTSARASGGS